MTPLTTPDDRRKGWGIFSVLGLIALACLAVPLLLTGCAAVDLLAACAKRSAGCQ